MARTRPLKPKFFKNEALATLPYEWRILYEGLWGLADREGRLEERPLRIKAEVFPYDNVNIAAGLAGLESVRLITRYEVEHRRLIAIPTWKKHVKPWGDEPPSILPGPHENGSAQLELAAAVGILAFDDGDASDMRSHPLGAPPEVPPKVNGTSTGSTVVDPLAFCTSNLLTETPILPPGKEPPTEGSPSPARNARAHEGAHRSTLMSRFELFWQAYPRRQGRGAALRSWERLKPTDALLARMLAAIEQQRQLPDWLRENGRFIPHPATWLNQQRWLDEGVDVAAPTVSATTRANLANATVAKAYLRSRR